MTVEPLSALDASFLYVERPTAPVHVGAVAVFEGGPLLDEAGRFRLDDLLAALVERLPLLPRLRQRVVWPPLGIARPCWVEDDGFDVTRHVDVVTVPEPGGDEELRALAERTFAAPLDLSRPLWHLRFVTGLSGGRIGMIERIHHAMVDGVSGVDLATILLDVSPDPAPPAAPAPPAGDAPQRRLPLLAEELLAAAATPAALGGAAIRALRRPGRYAAAALDGVRGLVAATTDGWLKPRSSLNAAVGGERHLAWVRADLEAVKAAGRSHGATVNDVLLAAVGGGLRTLLRHRDEVLEPDTTLKILVPVSRRPDHQRGTLGNQVAAMLFGLPVGLDDPLERLRAVHAETVRLKSSHEVEATELLLGMLGLLPPALLRLTGPAVAHQPLVNVIVTNVPGTPFPLYMLGARMLEAHPFVPVAGNLALNVAILSYDGACNLTITADRAAVPDADLLAGAVEAELRALGAVPGRRRKAAAPARKATARSGR